MSDDDGLKAMGQVIQIDEARIRDHLDEMVRGTVEETLNATLVAGTWLKNQQLAHRCDDNLLGIEAAPGLQPGHQRDDRPQDLGRARLLADRREPTRRRAGSPAS